MNLNKEFRSEIPSTKVDHPALNDAGVTLFINRLDLTHPFLSGNKYYKLKYNLSEAEKQGHDSLLTFGGAYSNHIYATAAAGKIFNFKTIGVIRGEEHKPLNPTLSFANKCGMKFYYLNRKTYRSKTNPIVIELLEDKFGKFYLIPEGGSNALAVKGCTEIVNSIEVNFDHVCCAVGTGGTLAGLAAGLAGNKKALGFSILRGASFLNENVSSLLQSYSKKEITNWQINFDYHFGGYAKFNIELINFIEEFERQSKIPIEPIYTGKMLYGIFDLVKKGSFTSGETIIAIHTGGLQGLAGLRDNISQLKNEI
ncbi:MAG: pyridoxal-phosphate dependent enzyme [Ignavibacteria bacterium]|nr:pyridoxal-phosphate dependent enzyme [Ignavibacteria bacterium]MBT8392950.1 pyridoxal-phosphate dependent enzyme [Ignavibacteria bacterium]NNL19737.1 1-aminocyclopropane-1-carboxylate deaminase/D-cysteine desulfhydrase [Ignavibacteriaceae bacterium]